MSDLKSQVNHFKVAQTSDATSTPPQRGTSEEASKPQSGLGILTKYVAKHFREETHSDTGEIVSLETVSLKYGSSTVRQTFDLYSHELEKWLMKRQARSVLMKLETRPKKIKVYYTKLNFELVPFFGEVWSRGKESFKLEDLPNVQKNAAVFRVVNCGRDKIKMTEDVELWKSKATEKCSFHKVQVCGSVWTCPTCSAKINLKRQSQIQSCYDVFSTQPDSDSLMVTFTIRHGFSDQLADTFSSMKEAFRLLQMTRTFKKIAGYNTVTQSNGIKTKKHVPSDLSFVGRISATEITHGKNGWHPHMHQLWFFDRRLSFSEIEKLRSELFTEWHKCCVAVGLEPPLEFFKDKPLGVHIVRALSAAQYLSKFGSDRQWGVEKEMASSHSKKAKLCGRTPFQILFDSMSGCSTSSSLFLDYAHATLGKHQLEFTPKLKARLNDLGVFDLDQSDEDIALALEDESLLLGALSDAEFTALCHCPKDFHVEPFSTVLMICRLSGFNDALKFIHGLPSFSRL